MSHLFQGCHLTFYYELSSFMSLSANVTGFYKIIIVAELDAYLEYTQNWLHRQIQTDKNTGVGMNLLRN